MSTAAPAAKDLMSGGKAEVAGTYTREAFVLGSAPKDVLAGYGPLHDGRTRI